MESFLFRMSGFGQIEPSEQRLVFGLAVAEQIDRNPTQSCLKRFADMVSAFENGRAGQDRPQRAPSSRDLGGPKADWRLSAIDMSKRTFTAAERRGSSRTDCVEKPDGWPA